MIVLNGKKPVLNLAFTPDGKQLLVSRPEEQVEVRAVPDGELLPSLPAKVGVSGKLFVHPAGRVVYVVEPKFAAVPLKGQSRVKCPNLKGVTSILFSRDGRFAVVRPESGQKHLRGFCCDAKGTLAAKPTWTVPPYHHEEKLGGFVGTGDRFVTVAWDTLVTRFTATGRILSTRTYPSFYAFNRLASPDGKWFASQGYDKFYLYNMETGGKPVRVDSGHTSNAMQPFAYHPTRPILMGLLGGATLVKYLNPDTGELLKKFRWNIGRLWCVAFSPDGTLAAAGGLEGKIVLWDVDE